MDGPAASAGAGPSWPAGAESVDVDRGPRRQARDFFSFLYFKKNKISKIYGGFEKFQNYTPVAQAPAWATGHKCKKNLHLGPGTLDALNSELVKSI